ncbi:MAG: hypothetical protein LQ338_000596 [Usnochroma carphineum]|nr:MAG: hypothetical protein LQ338_000596 [Usnochroma carphineum]
MPPRPPPHPPHPSISPGIQSLPVDFDHMNLGGPVPPHAGHQHMIPPPMGGLGSLAPEFDTSLLRKEKDTYEGYNFERINPQHPHEKATWALVTKTKMPLGQSELLAMVNKQKRKGLSAWQLLKSDEMKGFKRKQVDQLIDDRMGADPRFEFELAGLKLDQYNDRRGTRGTSAFQVILKRHLRKDLASSGPAGLGKLHEPHREIVDLTGGSEDPSEGSSRGFFGGGTSPPHHFVPPPPHHAFPDHHGFAQQPPHEPSFVHQPGPPMHEVHHDVHRGSPPPTHMPQFEGPFIHQDPHQAYPPPPFIPHMPPQMPPHDGHRERHKDARNGKQKQESKESKPYEFERKHKKAHSESDWDHLSESSETSQAYTDQTPDTIYSNNSSRKDKKGYHKDSRRSSRSHHDDYDGDRHDAVYRVHRRKPTMSPERSRPSGRSRHEVEEVEMIPATHMRSTRPYLTRSRTSAHGSDRPEYFNRPVSHSRHMSYDDERPRYSFLGLTPPGRRASVYAPKRTSALDLYDAHEEQERLEREEVRREILKEERRKDELRESVARQLERQAEGMRRPIGRYRGMSSDALYDERPGRYSRGYDNDRFWY